MKFADKIKLYRHHYRYTQHDVADKLKISPKTVSSWENGRSYPDIFMLVQISDLYQVSLDDLLREDREMIDSYKKEHANSVKKDHTFIISCIINAVGCLYFLLQSIGLLKFISSMDIGWKIILGIFILIISANIYLILARIEPKKISKSNKIGILITMVIIFVLLMKLDRTILPEGNNGEDFGRGFVTAIKTWTFTYLIWFYADFRKRWNFK